MSTIPKVMRSLLIASIVAVHGLNGHRIKTWTAKNNCFWLKECLPEDFKTARVLSYGYAAYTHDHEEYEVQQETLYGHAEDLVSALRMKRTKV